MVLDENINVSNRQDLRTSSLKKVSRDRSLFQYEDDRLSVAVTRVRGLKHAKKFTHFCRVKLDGNQRDTIISKDLKWKRDASLVELPCSKEMVQSAQLEVELWREREDKKEDLIAWSKIPVLPLVQRAAHGDGSNNISKVPLFYWMRSNFNSSSASPVSSVSPVGELHVEVSFSSPGAFLSDVSLQSPQASSSSEPLLPRDEDCRRLDFDSSLNTSIEQNALEYHEAVKLDLLGWEASVKHIAESPAHFDAEAGAVAESRHSFAPYTCLEIVHKGSGNRYLFHGPAVFFGMCVGEVKPFRTPRSLATLEERVVTNWKTFAMSYALISLTVVLSVMLSNAWLSFSVLIVSGLVWGFQTILNGICSRLLSSCPIASSDAQVRLMQLEEFLFSARQSMQRRLGFDTATMTSDEEQQLDSLLRTADEGSQRGTSAGSSSTQSFSHTKALFILIVFVTIIAAFSMTLKLALLLLVSSFICALHSVFRNHENVARYGPLDSNAKQSYE